MSTILKALKRVDQTTLPPDDLQSGPSIMDTQKAVKGRFFRIWLQRKALLTLIIAVVVITIGLLIYLNDSRISKLVSLSESDKPPIFQAKINPTRKAGLQGGQQSVENTKAERDRGRVGQPSPEPSRTPSGQPNQDNRLTQSKQQMSVPETKPPAKSNISRMSGAKAGDSDQSQTRAPAIAPTKKSKPGSAQTVRSYQRLDNDKLKLQAIAWSTVAAERIAVINDRIVREGESVEGYSINQIRQEDVVVNDGSQSWQLEFGLK